MMALEALPRQFRTGTSWELLNTDDPVIIAESEGKSRRKLRWMSEMEKKSLKVNTRKTKVMIIDPNLNSVKDSILIVASVERVSAETRFSALESLTGFIYSYCTLAFSDRIWSSAAGGAEVLPVQLKTSNKIVTLSLVDELDIEFCYLGDVIRGGGGRGSRIATRIRCA